MNKPLLVVAGVLMACALSAQQTLYVSSDGTGNGTSWTTPSSLHDALTSASSGTSLWLQAGTYLTSSSTTRSDAFKVPPGVTLLGGFSGSENSAAKRNPVEHVTILSGAIGSNARHDNAYTVVELRGDHSATVLDGLTIEGAYANGAGGPAEAPRSGGGVLITAGAPQTVTNPQFVNCTFVGNYARDGGAVYIDGRAATAKPNFVSCTFRQNSADLDGGAIYNDARRRGEVSPVFTDCTFEGNVANYGGAVFNQATKGSTQPQFSDCEFSANHAYVRGPSLYSIDHQGIAKVDLLGCTFHEEDTASPSTSTLARTEE